MESPVTRLERKYERLAAEGKLTRRKIEMIERRMKQITSRPDFRFKHLTSKGKYIPAGPRKNLKPHNR